MSIWPTIERFIARTRLRRAGDAGRRARLEPARGRRPHGGAARTAASPERSAAARWNGGRSPRRRRCWRGREDFRRLDKALGPDLGQCCGGRVLLTLERFDAAIATVSRRWRERRTRGRVGHACAASRPHGRPVRHVAAPGESTRAATCLRVKLRDGRIVERFGEDADAALSVRRGPCRPRAWSWRSRRCRLP